MNPNDQINPLLRHLQKDARSTPETLAAMFDGSEAAINEQIARWEKDGTILGYHAVLDLDKAGSTAVRAHIAIDLVPERGGGFDQLASRIARFEEVKDCFLMSGGYDLLVVIEDASLREVAQFVAEKVSTIDGVNSTTTSFQLKGYKQNGFLTEQEAADERLPVTP